MFILQSGTFLLIIFNSCFFIELLKLIIGLLWLNIKSRVLFSEIEKRIA